MSEIEDITQQFSRFVAAIDQFGDKEIKKQATEFKQQIDKYQAQLANHARIEAALEAVPTRAREMADRGADTKHLVLELTGLKSEFEISEIVCSSSLAILRNAWEEFQKIYSHWITVDTTHLEEKALEIFARGIQPLFEYLQSNRQKIEEIETKIDLLAKPIQGQSILPGTVCGLKNFNEALIGLLSAKLSLAGGAELPVASTDPESRHFYGLLQKLRFTATSGARGGLSEVDESVINALTLILAGRPETRKPVGLQK